MAQLHAFDYNIYTNTRKKGVTVVPTVDYFMDDYYSQEEVLALYQADLKKTLIFCIIGWTVFIVASILTWTGWVVIGTPLLIVAAIIVGIPNFKKVWGGMHVSGLFHTVDRVYADGHREADMGATMGSAASVIFFKAFQLVVVIFVTPILIIYRTIQVNKICKGLGREKEAKKWIGFTSGAAGYFLIGLGIGPLCMMIIGAQGTAIADDLAGDPNTKIGIINRVSEKMTNKSHTMEYVGAKVTYNRDNQIYTVEVSNKNSLKSVLNVATYTLSLTSFELTDYKVNGSNLSTMYDGDNLTKAQNALDCLCPLKMFDKSVMLNDIDNVHVGVRDKIYTLYYQHETFGQVRYDITKIRNGGYSVGEVDVFEMYTTASYGGINQSVYVK